MNRTDFITPQRVREIAKEFYREHGGCSSGIGAAVITYAMPEIARAVLLWAADNLWSVGYGPDPSDRLLQMAREIEP